MSTRELIEIAFADVPYPGDDNIADHQNCPECDDVQAFFRGKSWRDLKFPELRDFHSSLPLLTPQAFQYFLPGYMLATMGNWDQAEMIPYGILSIGGYSDETDAVQERREDAEIFNQKQREAIVAYLRELQSSPEWSYDGDHGIIEFAIKMILRETV